jgi:hypothetical protein
MPCAGPEKVLCVLGERGGGGGVEGAGMRDNDSAARGLYAASWNASAGELRNCRRVGS